MSNASDPPTSELDFAREVARAGSDIALGHFRREPEMTKKPDGTWATEADLAAEAEMRKRIARAYPEHNVLGEEEGLSAAGGGPPNPGAPTWVIDPIDGTNNFIAGIPVWATLVGLQRDGDTVVGVCHAPALNESYDAALGMGARFNGAPMRVDALSSLEAATVCVSGAESFLEAGLGGFFEALVARCYRSRGFADFWGHVLVARGAAHVMVETVLELWDVSALQPIVAEAGGRITHLDGSPWRERGTCLTTNGVLHEEVVGLWRTTTPKV